ncbi:hypothetical protein BKA62DRAFT_402640 [Auriculariales sp. MPI-PUGE-AT-0066]|nr:hypothetical protein BKA62DRAFT_402640 [Auriculariales sp. MPI-PUGE-AT-0066]
MLLGPVNLPWPILLHAVGLTVLGLFLVFETPRRPVDDRSPLGVATLGLGLAYLSTSYMPINENQFLHASAPVRMVLGVVAGIKLVLSRGNNPAVYTARTNLLVIFIYDGLGGAVLAYYLGTALGRIQEAL